MKLLSTVVLGCALLAPLAAHAELRGVTLYERGEYSKARQVLQRELRSPNLSEKDRIKARLYLSAALHASGAEAAARVQLEELFVTAPLLQVDPLLFPPHFAALAEDVRKQVETDRQSKEAERQRLEAERQRLEAERQKLEVERQQAAKPPPPPAPSEAPPSEAPPAAAEEARAKRGLQLTPALFGFVDPLGKAAGAGGSLTLGIGSLELGVRVLMGDRVGVGAEAGFLLGRGMLRPRLGLRGTALPSASAYGGGAVAGLRIHPASRLVLLVDVGAEYFSAPAQYRALGLTGSAGVGFDLL